MTAVTSEGKKISIPGDHPLRRAVQKQLWERYPLPKIDLNLMPFDTTPDYVYKVHLRPQDMDRFEHVNNAQQVALAVDALDMAAHALSSDLRWKRLAQSWLTSSISSFHTVPWREVLSAFDGQLRLADQDVQVAVWLLGASKGLFCQMTKQAETKKSVQTKTTTSGPRASVLRLVLFFPEIPDRSSL
eukprot:TRINITY_DN6355_c0_g1_i7.p1 TRINITY_DN6355_c0_g1~~TRINITY_DN6355_c0_g1_i7.p1  ORF type:complete len:216 (+),score=46.52 TRINITY_DN6355_c0_g1_i7:90-650(+)